VGKGNGKVYRYRSIWLDCWNHFYATPSEEKTKMSIFNKISIFLNNNTSLRYTTKSTYGSKMKFVFRYIYVDTSWRAYIVSSPGYGYRSTSMGDTHRYYDTGRSMHYVCWTQPLTRFADVVEISKVWARETAKYIATGESF